VCADVAGQLPGLVAVTELERLDRQLRGTTQARMLREHAKSLEVLAETYGWFTKGFDSSDSHAAMALLDA
jgi:hypothetical protein